MNKSFEDSGFANVIKAEVAKRQSKKTPMRFLGFKKEGFGETSAEFAVYGEHGNVSKVRLSRSECEAVAKDSSNPDHKVAETTLQQWPTA